ncbi:MAG: CaiB/BaiF CoA transferase family protein [Hyphomicrobiales bacterium]
MQPRPAPSGSPDSEAPKSGWQPLRDVRVLDFTALLPGPFATLALADLGADVVKVEPPAGDFARRMPSSLFRMANRNKRSIVLDLKHAAAPDIVRRLALWADVAIEGFRPGVAERLRIGPANLLAHNPRLIYCRLSGYGQSGPARHIPGHDLNYLCAAGAMALAGHWGEAPRRSAIPVADLAGGTFAAIAILAALHERARSGKGRVLDLSLAEAAMSFAAIRHGLDLDRPSQEHLWPTNDLFETADGEHIALGIVEEHFWRNFASATQDLAPDLGEARYATEADRRRNGDALSARLREVMGMRRAADWLARFERHDVPAQLRLTPAQASRSAQIVERQMVMAIDGERHIPFPVRVDGERGAALRRLAPAAGEHSAGILEEIGLAREDIAALAGSGLFGSEPAPMEKEKA